MKRTAYFSTTASFALAAACIATTAHAQDAGDSEVREEEQRNVIVVTAQFREQALQDTPIAITAVTSELLEARSQTELVEVAQQAPSVVLRNSTSAFGNSISASIRGLGQIDFNPQLEPGVGIYIDDVYYPRLTGANFDLLDVERVEILRGPQGTLTGRNSEGGAIRFVSRRPDGSNTGYVEGTYGSRQKVGVRAGADFSLTDNLFARVSGSFKTQDGYVDRIDYGCAFPSSGIPSSTLDNDCVVEKLGETDYKAARGMLRYVPTDSIDITISGDYVKDTGNNGAEVLLYLDNSNPNVLTENGIPGDSRFVCGDFCNYASYGQSGGTFVGSFIRPDADGVELLDTRGYDDQQRYESWGVSANVEIDISERLRLTSITAYREFTNYFVSDADMAPTRLNFGVNDVDSDFFSQELRLNVDLADWAVLTVGGYYSEENTTYDTLQDLRYVSAGPNPIYPLQFLGSNPVETDSKAVFATAILDLTERLTLTLGGRYTDESKSTLFGRFNYDNTTINRFVDPVGAFYGAGYNGPDTADFNNNGNTSEVVTALTGFVGTYEGDRFDYRVSVDYRFSDALLAYATISTGFKGGGIAPRPFNAAQVQPFGPEELTAYELGLKTDFFDNRVRLNLAGFYNDFTDAQLTLLACPQFGGPGPCALPQNAGDATVKGIEVELSAEPVDDFDINASLSYLDFEWDCVVPTVVDRTADPSAPCSSDPAVVDLLATPPRGVANWQWSVGAQYRADLGDAGSLTPRLDVSYQGELVSGATVPAPGSPSDQFGTIEAYTLANARLTWRNPQEDLSIALAVTNLLDKYYQPNKFDLTGAGAGFITASVGRPREWSVTVRKEF
ncbi:TonB-dependent receptor [Aurantiacibacter rhizosphaerae]|uniref:TonB-dependent receptor n=1 Tax=Aurantiacibacter rhizosphaerae TaxID=2691582 RepID=UPI0013665F7E|nr:TonB-dependent receptor [Aurantiacibacter rhizosphaerae]